MSKTIAASLVWALAVLTSTCQAQPQRASQTRAPLFAAAPGPPLEVGGRPHDVAVADLNRDGKADVVTCNVEETVSVFLGDGRGGFRPAPGSPLNAPAHMLAAGDVNNDGSPDLALTHHDSSGVTVFLGAGDGRFAPAPGSPFPAHQGGRPHNHGLALADVDADGDLDATTSNQDDNSVSLLLGDGRGRFTPAAGSPFAVGRAPYPHALGDLNGDGKLDIAVPNISGGNLTVLLGDGRGGFKPAPHSPYVVASRPYHIAIGDVSGDGKPDLVTTHDDINLLTIMAGDGRGGFAAAPGSPLDLGRRAFKLVAADVNGDARADLVVGHETGDSVSVLLSDGRGGYAHAAGSPYAAGRSPRVAVGDVNGDGRPDVIAAGYGSSSITVLLGR